MYILSNTVSQQKRTHVPKHQIISQIAHAITVTGAPRNSSNWLQHVVTTICCNMFQFACVYTYIYIDFIYTHIFTYKLQYWYSFRLHTDRARHHQIPPGSPTFIVTLQERVRTGAGNPGYRCVRGGGGGCAHLGLVERVERHRASRFKAGFKLYLLWRCQWHAIAMDWMLF